MSIPTEKLQKVLARAGLGSRREIEHWIEQGRVTINDNPATIGDRVDAKDKIKVDGKAVRLAPVASKTRVIIYYKPEGEVCTRSDPEGRPTVFEKLPSLHGQRWVMIGRLDLNTSGLLMFTNNGELANRLLHPSYEIEREYAVRVLGDVTDAMINRLKRGVKLEDGPAAFVDVKDMGGTGANHWYHVVLKEGRQREVRRLWESQGIQVSRLMRVRFGNVLLPRDLRRGQWRDMEVAEIANLESLVQL